MTTVPTSATPAQLLARLRTTLPKALPTTLTTTGPHPTAPDDLYEAYIFALVIDAARSVGYSVQFVNGAGTTATILHLRRSPGRIASSGTPGGPPFTHAVLSSANRPDLEVHTGILVVGKSKVVHEADLVILPREQADRCRRFDVDPPSSSAILSLEAKYYTMPVALSTAREFLGLSKDLSPKQIVFACTVASASAMALLAGTSSVEYDDGVLPSRNGEVSLREYVRRILRNYKTRR